MIFDKLTKREHVIGLCQHRSIGVELGIAEGELSERLLSAPNRFSMLYGIDSYEGGDHTREQYQNTIKRLHKHSGYYSLYMMRFDQALELFPDNSLDFVYVDGFAHTGQENGKTIHDWYSKVRPNGIIAGDDYHEHFPGVTNAVGQFADQHNLRFGVIDAHEPYSVWSEYPTWYARKPVPIAGKSVAIVGNSSGLLNRRMGDQINSHDVVIRMNKHHLLRSKQYNTYASGHPENVGNRTDIWAVWRMDEYYDHDYFDVNIHAVQLAAYYGTKHPLVEMYSTRHLLELMYEAGVDNPSSGIRTIDWVLRQNPKKVSVFGFDWKKNTSISDPNRKNDPNCPHDFESEKEYCLEYLNKKNPAIDFYP